MYHEIESGEDEGWGRWRGTPGTLSVTIDLPFTAAEGFLTDEEINVNVSDTLRLRNETTGSGSITIYVITEDGQYSTGALLGSMNQQIVVNNDSSVEKTVLASSGKYLLSKNAPPIDPNDPGGSTITIIVIG